MLLNVAFQLTKIKIRTLDSKNYQKLFKICKLAQVVQVLVTSMHQITALNLDSRCCTR